MNKKYLFALFIALVVLFAPKAFNKDVKATVVCSGAFKYPTACAPQPSGDCAATALAYELCADDGAGQCYAYKTNTVCAWVNGECKPTGDGSKQYTACGGEGGCPCGKVTLTECTTAVNCQNLGGTYSGSCFDAYHVNCTYAECKSDCSSSTPTPGGGGGGSTPTPGGGTGPTSTPAPAAYCQNILAYDTNWTRLTNQQLATTVAGDQLYYCVSGYANTGTFDKARFTINGVLYPDTTLLRPGSTADYCYQYKVPANVYSFNVQGEVHNTVLGWFK